MLGIKGHTAGEIKKDLSEDVPSLPKNYNKHPL
jgi:hypothetical protein